jgi:hypothetical protein
MVRFVVLLVVLAVGCDSKPPSRTAPREAFARLATCVDRADRACLYRELDRDSRWSIQTIHRTLAEMRSLVERSYPAPRRAEAYGSWSAEAATGSPDELFDVFCRERDCLTELARGFGAVSGIEDESRERATIVTTRGGRFELANRDGEWGLATWCDELQAAKIHLGHALEQVRRNAQAFEQQRRAVSDGGGAP